MKYFLLLILSFLSLFSDGQTNYSEIADSNIRQRVLLIRSRTDSFIKRMADKSVFKRLTGDFGVTYLLGEFYRNYLFLNKDERDANNIHNLTQYYSINDETLGLSDTIGIYYWELPIEYATETNRIEVRFKSNDDFLKVKTLNYLYRVATQEKLTQLIKSKKLKAPTIKIAVDSKNNTYIAMVKDNDKPHNYPL